MLVEDTAEGTLEDEAAPAVMADDFLGAMDEVLGVKPKTKMGDAEQEAEPLAEGDEDGIELDAGAIVDDEEAGAVAVDEEDGIELEAGAIVDDEGEAVVAEGEEGETVAAAVGEEEEAEPLPMPKPKYGRRWLGGTLVGTLLATAACVAVVIYMPEIPQQIREVVGVEEPSKDKPGQKPGQNPKPGQQQVASLDDLLRAGDFSREVPKINDQNGDDLAKRGEYLWGQFLTKGKEPRLDDEQVKKRSTTCRRPTSRRVRPLTGPPTPSTGRGTSTRSARSATRPGSSMRSVRTASRRTRGSRSASTARLTASTCCRPSP